MKINFNLKSLREKLPLIHIISNSVTSARVADFTLSIGASPIMAEYSKEVSEITEKAKALVLNMGMLNEDKIESIKISAKVANEKEIPIVFDPVGVASSKSRRDLAEYLLKNNKFNVIRGNFSEINYLVNGETFTGVDSNDTALTENDFINLAVKLNKKTDATIVVSGKYEIIANSHIVISIPGGDENLKKITGLGDMESAMIASLLAYPMSNLKACVLSSIFLRQIANNAIKDGSIINTDIIRKLQSLDEITGDINIVEPSYKFEKNTLYGISTGDEIVKIKKAVDAGMSIYQLRDKLSDNKNLEKKIINIKNKIQDKCIFILNDNLDLANKFDISLHLGQDDEKISVAREILGRDKIIGATAKTVELAIAAENMGASYIGSGAFFKTETKKNTSNMILDIYKEIREAVIIPVFPIGGINLENLNFFDNVKIPGVCMSSGIFSYNEDEIKYKTTKIIEKLQNK